MVKGSGALARVRSFRSKPSREAFDKPDENPATITVSTVVHTEAEPNTQQQDSSRTSPSSNHLGNSSPRRGMAIDQEPTFMSPQKIAAQQRNLDAQRPPHLQLSKDHHVVEEDMIGMALGSPSQGPFPILPSSAPTTRPSFTDSTLGSSASSQAWPGDSPYTEEAIKLKGKWKMFGGIFGKKGVASPTSPSSQFYQLQLSPALSDQGSQASPAQTPSPRGARGFLHHGDSGSANGDATRKKMRSRKESRPEVKPDIVRAKSTPLIRNERQLPTPPPKDSQPDRRSPQLWTDGKPMMLQVEIPDVAMERYSIMFGNVLQQRPPSLMVRRQAPLEKLKSLGSDKHEMPEYSASSDSLLRPTRRATSPSPRAKSRCFSLFPPSSPDPNRGASPQPSRRAVPLSRSATAPGSLSPARATFDFTTPTSRDNDSHEIKLHHPRLPFGPPDRSSESIDSTTITSISGDLKNAHAAPTFPDEPRVTPHIITSPPPYSSSISHDTRSNDSHSSQPSPRSSSLPENHPSHIQRKDSNVLDHSFNSNTNPPHPPVQKSSPKEQSNRPVFKPRTSSQSPRDLPRSINAPHSIYSPHIQNPLSSSPPSAAEISVARQISVSRRQQQLLVPITPKTVRPPKRATIVDVDAQADGDAGGNGGKTGHVSRKSHHLIVEEA